MRSALPIAAFLCLSIATATATAEETTEETRYGQFFNGAFVEVAARAAATRVTSATYAGWSWDVGLRQALVMHLLDTRLSFGEDRFAPREGASGDELVARSVMVHGAFHPAYLALLLSNWFGYVLASLYVEAGVGMQLGHSATADRTDLGARFSLGAGLDVPITDPDRGWSLWLNGLWRYTWSDFDYDSGAQIDLYHHAAWGGLALRFNGLLF